MPPVTSGSYVRTRSGTISVTLGMLARADEEPIGGSAITCAKVDVLRGTDNSAATRNLGIFSSSIDRSKFNHTQIVCPLDQIGRSDCALPAITGGRRFL